MGDVENVILSNPKFFKMLPNGDFDTEQYEDENDWDPDEEQVEEGTSDQGILVEKREARKEVSELQIESGKQKKGRFETSEIPQLC